MTRTELIARLRDPSGADHTLFDDAADMLEDDGAAIQLALDALVRADKIAGYANNKTTIAALKEVLK